MNDNFLAGLDTYVTIEVFREAGRGKVIMDTGCILTVCGTDLKETFDQAQTPFARSKTSK